MTAGKLRARAQREFPSQTKATCRGRLLLLIGLSILHSADGFGDVDDEVDLPFFFSFFLPFLSGMGDKVIISSDDDGDSHRSHDVTVTLLPL